MTTNHLRVDRSESLCALIIMPTPIRQAQGKQKKIETVEKLTTKVTQAKSLVFVDYRGLKHKQLEELRKLLKKTEAEFVVTKNRLLLRALSARADEVKDVLQDVTATLFAYADEVAPLKELIKFFKTAGSGKAKGALWGTTVLTEGEVTRLAQLPPRQVLLGQLAAQLQAPLWGLHYALSWNIRKLMYALRAIKEQKH